MIYGDCYFENLETYEKNLESRKLDALGVTLFTPRGIWKILHLKDVFTDFILKN